MAKEIGVDRPVSHLAQLLDRLRSTLRLQCRAAHRAQAACRTDRRGKVDRANAAHRSQYQRMLDAKEVDYSSIGPHSHSPHQRLKLPELDRGLLTGSICPPDDVTCGGRGRYNPVVGPRQPNPIPDACVKRKLITKNSVVVATLASTAAIGRLRIDINIT